MIANADIGSARACATGRTCRRRSRVVGVNVAGEAARVRLEAQLARWRIAPEWLTAGAAACGVQNRYARPAQLGADRWASLCAARRRSLADDLFPPACVVVNAGTAVTVDALDADGVFRGGLILPGLRLMLRALAENTAALKVAPGEMRPFPDNTADALYSGAMQRGVRRDRADAPARRSASRRRCAAISRAARRPRSRRTSTRRSRSWIIWCWKACSRWPGAR